MYELRADEGDHTPTEFERLLIEDAIAGLWSDEEFLTLISGKPQASADAFDFCAHLDRQREWSGRTFGPGSRAKGVVDHIRKELREIESDPGDLREWVDVIILALDGAWRSGATPQEIIDAIVAKQTKNEGRAWPDWRTMDPNKAIEHDRTQDAPPNDGKTRVVGEYLTGGCLNWEDGEDSAKGADDLPDLDRAEACHSAVAAIYFADSADYLSALRSVVSFLNPTLYDLLGKNERAAFEAAKAEVKRYSALAAQKPGKE
ncbi:hypothetical protein CAL20_02745 [Bordetella genomosp. 4]|uniref:dATP/dGTP diphosphohydrolase MazZ domain-containing protein n=2 Tax=Bordetella genomosp. 4 TaxID=463044 RepID=A0A261UTP6_9BORD|nr:hypothetical protein CAL20_02745 [Bordetella genomosp. 4]